MLFQKDNELADCYPFCLIEARDYNYQWDFILTGNIDLS